MSSFRQLAILRYNGHPCFAHALICSTAPTNAEDRIRVDITEDCTDQHLSSLKKDLKRFIQSQAAIGSMEIAAKLKVILNIHGYNMPLKRLEKSYEQLQEKFEADIEKQKPDDFVLFIDYSWPSEGVFVSQCRSWLLAMPFPLLLLLGLAIAGLRIGGVLHGSGLWLLGFCAALIVLRLVVYFRDRDRAANYGVYDAVELVRWLRVLISDQFGIDRPLSVHDTGLGTIQLSFIAHSMGCFVATQAVRMLSDVFDENAIDRWKKLSPDGPFGDISRCIAQPPQQEQQRNLSQIGNLFTLKQLILVAPDIPVWSVTTGRSNYLLASLRRFEESFLFVNDADIVLRLASTLANYFVFPSRSMKGGYRLGNLSISKQTLPGVGPYGEFSGTMSSLVLNGIFGSVRITSSPFNCENNIGLSFSVISCTDYKDTDLNDKRSCNDRRLSGLSANHLLGRLLNYSLTTLLHFTGVGGVDSHGGYFRGKFCLGLFYSLLLYGHEKTGLNLPRLSQDLRRFQLTWLKINA